jgi:hypothetical protein
VASLVENYDKKNRNRFPIAVYFDRHVVQSLNDYKVVFLVYQLKLKEFGDL